MLLMNKDIFLCEKCDEILPLDDSIKHFKCPVCYSHYKYNYNLNLNLILSLSITTFIILITISFAPILAINLIGNSRSISLFSCVYILMYQYHYMFIGIIVILLSFVIPLLYLMNIIFNIICLKNNVLAHYTRDLLKINYILAEYSLIDVYFISLLISAFKLHTLAFFTFHWGTIFIALTYVLLFIIQYIYDNNYLWELYEFNTQS